MPDTTPNIRSLFDRALEIPGVDERQAYLDYACAGLPGIRQQVESLLAAHAAAGSFLETPHSAVGREASPTIDQPVASPGTQIGPYKLIEQIGEGGMGTVWMAQQSEPVKRLVAVKLIKAGMDSRQVIARFEAERQALALMDHPNIARVLDAGTTLAGRPYFVMDLVRGVPITRFCDEHHLTPNARLELFIPVCQAIQHAHQKGIIHRDLKPNNVLVALYDGKPVPKVIDFGVAKATGQSLTDKTLITGFGSIVGTLEYMSPEQAEINQLDIDTRSDIYSLGVLLYELLTGSTPFSRNELEKAGMLEMLRVIREEEPSKPSAKLSQLSRSGLPSRTSTSSRPDGNAADRAGDSGPARQAGPTLSLASIAANRGTEPAKLTKLVRGELDWIVMKALEKDRNRRYETANGFAMDVQRYLADEAVQACPPSTVYRLRKIAQRNKGGLAVAALVLFFLVLLGSGAGWTWRDRSAREAEAARQQDERLAKAGGQVERILAEVDQLEKEQKWPEALAAVRRAEAIVAGGEVNELITERVHKQLKDLQFIDRLERIRMLKVATDQRLEWDDVDQAYSQAFRDYGVDVDGLGVEEAVSGLKACPELTIPFAAALDHWFRARHFHQKSVGGNADDWKRLVAVARGLDPEPLRDQLRSLQGQPAPKARDELRRLADSIDVPSQHPATLILLVDSLREVELPDSALKVLRSAQFAYPGDFWLNSNLGQVLAQHQNYEESVRFHTAAAAARTYSDITYSNLGYSLQRLKRLDEAVAAFRKSIELNPGSSAYVKLGNLLQELGRPKEALAVFREAIDTDAQNPNFHFGLGRVLRAQVKPEEADAAIQKGVDLLKAEIERDPKNASGIYTQLGHALYREKPGEAISAYSKAIELDPLVPAIVRTSMGNLLYQQGKLDEALSVFNAAITVHPDDANAYNGIGNVLGAKGKAEDAIAMFRKAIQLDPRNVSAHLNLGNHLMEQKKLDEAAECFLKAIEIDPRFAHARHFLGELRREQKRFDSAIDAYLTAIELDPSLVAAHVSLARVLTNQQRFGEAAAAYKKAIELNPKTVDLYINFGNALLDLKKLDEALAVYKKAVELDPKNARAHYHLGWSLYETGKFEVARDAFATALQHDNTHTESRFGLAATFAALKMWDRATTEYALALEKAVFEDDPKPGPWTMIADHRELFDRLVQTHPKDHRLWQARGRAFAVKGDWDAAAADFARAIETADKSNNPWFGSKWQVALDASQWGELQDRLLKTPATQEHVRIATVRRQVRDGQIREAAETLRPLAHAKPHSFHNQMMAMLLAAGGGEPAEYLRVCEALLDRGAKPNWAPEAERTAKVCLLVPGVMKHRQDQIIAMAEYGVANSARHPTEVCWFDLTQGLARYRAGDFEAARSSLQKSLTGKTHCAILARLVLAMIDIHTGQVQQARADYEQILAEMDREFSKGSVREQTYRSMEEVPCLILRREVEQLLNRDPGELLENPTTDP